MYILIFLLLLNLPAPMSLDEEPASQVVDMTLRHDIFDRLRYGTCQSMDPMDAPQEKLLAQPDYRSEHPLFYTAEFGDGEDRITTLVVDESEGTGKGYDLLYVDSNNDNRLDGEREKYGLKVDDGYGRFKNRIHLSFTTAGKTVDHQFSFVAFFYKRKKDREEVLYGRLEESSYFSGEAVIAGERRAIAIADMDSNGFFNDREESLFHGDRFFVDVEPPFTEGSLASFPYGKYTEVLGKWYVIEATPEGSRVEIREAAPALGTITATAGVLSATLRSAEQTLVLDFSEGGAQGVAGTYRLHEIGLRLQDEKERWWTNNARIKTDGPEIVVREGETTSMTAGFPLCIEITASQGPDKEETELLYQCMGTAGEIYGQWRIFDDTYSTPPELSFEILDEKGGLVHSDKVEYG